ncbi:unnamed protein product [Cuscuta europaea]|uniref:Uncharacterized protein n=1 Tax=Cuscuta europaea TaxID=41803 RepID=A0A9P1EMK9_CUSEU|nr:unnamed protein product [Cuscuta europaea]
MKIAGIYYTFCNAPETFCSCIDYSNFHFCLNLFFFCFCRLNQEAERECLEFEYGFKQAVAKGLRLLVGLIKNRFSLKSLKKLYWLGQKIWISLKKVRLFNPVPSRFYF